MADRSRRIEYLGYEKLAAGPRDRGGGGVEPVGSDATRLATHLAESELWLIAREIAPLLTRATDAAARAAAVGSAGPAALGDAERARFLEALLQDSAAAAAAQIDALRTRGLSESALLDDLLAWTAMRLGTLWEEDREDFADVTVGLCRLHEILRNRTRLRGEEPGPDAPQILLATNGDDNHIFGLLLVADRFRRGGWRVWTEPGAGVPALASLLAEIQFDVLGLSASRDAQLAVLISEIEAYRKASRNRGLKLLVGGSLFTRDPALADRVGADATAPDAEEALRVAEGLIAQGPFRRRRSRPR